MMDELFMSEVNEEIARIKSARKESVESQESFCSEDNLVECLKYMNQEFDYFDVSCLKEPFDLTDSNNRTSIIIQLVNSSYKLLQLHKETKKQEENSLERHSRLASDVKTLTKTVTSLRQELAVRNQILKINQEKITLNRIENDELKAKITHAKKEINIARKENVSEQSRHTHEVQKILTESHRLQTRFRKNCGEFVSRDSQVVATIEEYKKTEAKHLEMIKKLQNNNHELLEQILHLKQLNL